MGPTTRKGSQESRLTLAGRMDHCKGTSISRVTPSKDEGSRFMEDETFWLPVLENGVLGLGDLYDCRSNTPLGNIFQTELIKEDLEAHFMEIQEYDLYHSGDTATTLDHLNFSGEVKIELSSGTPIKIHGKVEYDQSSQTNFDEQLIRVNYQVVTAQVRLRPSASTALSPIVKRQLLDGTILATHYVEAVTLGGQAHGKLQYSENVNKSNMMIDGSIKLEMKVGSVNIDAKASFKLLDKEYAESYNTRISLNAMPSLNKSPTNVGEMFDEIETLDKVINQQQHFPQLGPKVCGVPIGFRLVPIYRILDEVEGEVVLLPDPVYKLMTQQVLSNFQSMISTLQDFINPEYIKAQICQRKSALAIIIRDAENPLTKEVTTWSLDLITTAKELKLDALLLFSEYKQGHKTEIDIQNFVKKYDESFDILSVRQKIEDFVAEGKRELNGIRAADVVELEDTSGPTVSFFSNQFELDEWYDPDNSIKVLLTTNTEQGSPSGIFLKLFKMSSTLKRNGIQVGVAFPNLSKDFSLTFKTGNGSRVYSAEEIPFVLEVIGIAVDEGESISTLFYSLNASLSGLNLPMVDYLQDIPSLVTVMNDYQNVKICETSVQLMAALSQTLDSWNLVLPVQALNTGVEMVRFFRQLQKVLLERVPSINHGWFVSRFSGTNHTDSPLLFLFKDDVLEAVCMDRLDILILTEQLTKSPSDLSLISYKRMKESCLYIPRVEFATDIIPNLILEHSTGITEPIEMYAAYPSSKDKCLEDTMSFVRAACKRDEPNILTCVALQAIILNPEIEGHLTEFGWKDGQFERGEWRKNDWGELVKKLRGVLGASAPFLMKVVSALNELGAIPTDIDDSELEYRLVGIVKFLQYGARGSNKGYRWKGMTFNEEDVFKELKEEINAIMGDEKLDLGSKRNSITTAFQAFYDILLENEEYFYIGNFISLVDALSLTQETLPTFKHILDSMAEKYCGRLSGRISTEDYPNAWRKMKEALARRQLFKVLGVLAQVQYHPLLYLIQQELFNLTALPAPTAVKSIIQKLSLEELGYFDEEGRLEVIWNNPKFLYMLRQVIDNDGVLGSLFVFVSVYDKLTNKRALSNSQEEEEDEDTMIMVDPDAEEEISVQFPKCIPSDIVEKVKPMFALRKGPEFNWLKTWPDLQSLIDTFQIISTRRQMPLEFPAVLRDNMEQVKSIRDLLEINNCLYHWNQQGYYFEHPWSVHTIKRCVQTLMTSLEEDINRKRLAQFPQLPFVKTEADLPDQPDLRPLNDNWKRFTKNGTIMGVSSYDFLALNPLLLQRMTEYENLSSACQSILPFILQQLKFSNWTILSPKTVSHLVSYPYPGLLGPGQIDFGDGVPNSSIRLVLSRSDIQTALFHSAQPFVLHQILDVMVQGCVALPLIVPNIRKPPIQHPNPIPKEKGPERESLIRYKLLVKSLQSLVVPELEPLVPQPHLFQTPFHFVLTLRVGDTGPDPGRSSLLNKLLLKDQYTFSSSNEPGTPFGRSLERNGLLEFIWLSKKTCEENLWTNYILPQYLSERKEMILLGNLHGDATQFSSMFETLKPLVSSYIVFWKASNWSDLKGKKKELSKAMTAVGRAQVLDVVLYPDSSIAQKVHEQNLLLKDEEGSSGMGRINQAKLQRIFKEAMRTSVNDIPIYSTEDDGNSSKEDMLDPKSPAITITTLVNMELQEGLPTKESSFLNNFVETHTIDTIKKSFQKCEGSYLEEFFVAFNKLLALPLQSRLNGLLHFQYELDYLSRRARKETLARVRKLRNSINERYREEVSPKEKWVLDVQNEIKMYLEELELETLSVQDIFRAAYTPATWNDRGNNLPISYNQYFLYFKYGFPVELLHPTYGQGMFQLPLNKFFQQLPKNTRVFVISMAGIKDSGKSTLLNRLFGYGFREDSSTFGLQMRLLWLDEDYKDELNCDAFILIDSEGMGGGENKVDAGADAWERRLLTFLLGISDLTLINSLGSTLDEMDSILQISFASLSKGGPLAGQPDLILVHQQATEEESLLGQEFTQCLDQTLHFSTSNEFKSGTRVREASRLESILARVKHGEIIHLIRPPGQHAAPSYAEYQTDVQTLYSKILMKCRERKCGRVKLGGWYEMADKFWKQLQSSEFPFRQPTLSSLKNKYELESRLAEVKEAIGEAFRVHEKVLDNLSPKEIEEMFDKYEPASLGEMIELFMRTRVDGELRKVISNCSILEQTTASTSVGPNACQPCCRAFSLREALLADIIGMKRGFLIEDEIRIHSYEIRESIYLRFQQAFLARQFQEGKFEQRVLQTLQEIQKGQNPWVKLLQFVSTEQTVIPARSAFNLEVQEVYKSLPHVKNRHLTEGGYVFPRLEEIQAFEGQNALYAGKEGWKEIDWLVSKIEEIPPKIFQDYSAILFKRGMTLELQRRVERLLQLFQARSNGQKLLLDFMWEVHLYGILFFSKFMDGKQEGWDILYNPLQVVLKRGEDIFQDLDKYSE